MPGAVRIAADDTHGPEHAGALGTETAKVFFGITTRQAFRRGTFRFAKNLTSATGRFIDAYNQRWPAAYAAQDVISRRQGG